MSADAPALIAAEPSRRRRDHKYQRTEKGKAARRKHEEKRKTQRVEVRCVGCGLLREVRGTTANRYHRHRGADAHRLCRSCSRKSIRGNMRFKPRNCQACGASFSGRSGNARFCDNCSGRKPPEPKVCQVCGRRYVRHSNATACSDSCKRRLRWNTSYYGGRLFEAAGWAEKVCQLCERHVPKRAHVHHVFGHPNHSRLVVLCAGCHDVVSKLARRPGFGETQFLRLRWYALAQRLGRDPNESAA